MLSSPLSDLFIVNNTRHIDIGIKENVYRLFSFHGTHIWNHISQKKSIVISYVCFKNLSKMDIQANNIPYRLI